MTYIKAQKRASGPAGWEYTEETLPDGTTAMTFANGAKGSFPPLPGGSWRERKARELSRINYDIKRRLAEGEAGAGAKA